MSSMNFYPAILMAEGDKGLEAGLEEFRSYMSGGVLAYLKLDSMGRTWRRFTRIHASRIARRFRKAGLKPVRRGIPGNVMFAIRTPGPEALLQAKKAWFRREYDAFMQEIAGTDLEAFSKHLGAVSRLRDLTDTCARGTPPTSFGRPFRLQDLVDPHEGEAIFFRGMDGNGHGPISRYVRLMEPDRTYYFIPLDCQSTEIA